MKFADDTKLFRKTKEIGDKHKLQDDIDKLVKWSEKLQMLFSFGKCKFLHTGPENTGMNYEIAGTILSKTVKEKDLGVDHIEVFKIVNGCENIDSNIFFKIKESKITTRWRRNKVKSIRCSKVFIFPEDHQCME